ncbi:S-phase kinase-associated protein 2 isoform X1 [Danaus plexippus]|uniref:S-phase kinase-associated protein 2 isoform X1 n=1 Tax=Danaus plexippus TaxID=13037 RepID=UPI002AB090D9|nr:S-phase kinase-associated protein 2 isoform X1 [Danaus plexippus]
MNVNNIAEDRLAPALDVIESPRKRMRVDNSSRKSWSLMDRRTDSDVLNEMGVSLLDPEEEQSEHNVQKSLKRKHDIENVNPNVNSVSRGRFSPRSPLKMSPGPSKVLAKSPRSCDKAKPDLDSSLPLTYVNDEETPLGQSVAVSCKHAAKPHNTSKKENYFDLAPPVPSPPADGGDSFLSLSDEVVLSVMRWLPKRTLAHCMLVCKRWRRIASDETLWTRLDLGNKTLAAGALGKVVNRTPIVLRLAGSEIGEWHPEPAPVQTRIQYLDLSMCTIDYRTLESLLSRCSGLKKLSLENVKLSEYSQELIGKCSGLETLNLAMAQGITATGLTNILEGCPGLSSLNISWCNLSEAALEVLVTRLPQKLSRLNISGARSMTDENVQALSCRCPRLLELDVSDCSRLSACSLSALLPLTRLEHLALSRCYLLPPHALTKLSRMSSLQFVEVWGTLQHASLAALRAALPAVTINQFMFSAIARPTVGTRRTSVWGLRTRD